MLKIAVRINNDETEAKTATSWDEIHDFFFSPCYDDKYVIPLQVRGKTYAERKADLREQALEVSNVFPVLALSWWEVSEIGDFFERNGRRYGLLREFQENGIC